MIWKLLRQHISPAQLTGFFIANVCGMLIVLAGIQFYADVRPLFTGKDSFAQADYIVISKQVSTLGSLVGRSSAFSSGDVDDLRGQPFVRDVGGFKPAQFSVSAGLSIGGMRMSTDLFFESVPDRFVDVQSERWTFDPSSNTVPIILPRNYLNLYNFGFAKSKGLPQISEGLIGALNIDVRLSGNGRERLMRGNIVGFSNRLNTILVPDAFLDWANAAYGTGEQVSSSRLIVEVDDAGDERIASYLAGKGYEAEGGMADTGGQSRVLTLVTGIVLAVGTLITVLAFYILMLSIFLLLQKNSEKLETLLLIGYDSSRIARPYIWLGAALGGISAAVALAVTFVLRGMYMEKLSPFISAESGNMLPAVSAGAVLLLLMWAVDAAVIRRKIRKIGRRG